MLKILFFGRLGERMGREIALTVPEEGCTVAELRYRLAREHPDAAADLAAAKARACVGQAIATEDRRVLPGQEVAFIPPVSGG